MKRELWFMDAELCRFMPGVIISIERKTNEKEKASRFAAVSMNAAEIELSKNRKTDKHGTGGKATRAVARIVREMVADLQAIGALDADEKWEELTRQLQAIQGGQATEVYDNTQETTKA